MDNLMFFKQDLVLCFEFGIKLLIRNFMQYLALQSLTGNTMVIPPRLFRCHVA